MDSKTEILEREFDNCCGLLLAQTHIKHLKKQLLDDSVLDLLKTINRAIESLKSIEAEIDLLNNAAQLSADQQNKRDGFQLIQVDLVNEIDGYIRSVNTNIHLLTTGSELLSVLEDLEKATYIFKRRVISHACEQAKKRAEKCDIKSE